MAARCLTTAPLRPSQGRVAGSLLAVPSSRRPRLLVAQRPGIAVVLGAVRFGLSPSHFASRVLNFTYGVAVSEPYCASKPEHADVPEHKLLTVTRGPGSVKYVSNVFYVFVEKDAVVEPGKVVQHSFSPINADQSAVSFQVCKSAVQPPPFFVTDAGVVKCDQVEVPIPPDTGASVLCEFIFGEAEIMVRATHGNESTRCVLSFNQ